MPRRATPLSLGFGPSELNNNGRWIVVPHEADVSALSMNALVRRPVPACYSSRRSLTKKSKKVRPVLRPRLPPPIPPPHAGEGLEGARSGSHPRRPWAFSPRALVPWARGPPGDQLRP